MTLFLRELKRNRKSFLIWSAVLLVLSACMMSFFPTMAANAKKFDDLLKNYPKVIVKVFGVDRLSMSELIGYYAVEAYIFVTLLGSVFAIILGAGILSKEEGEKTIEFLYAKPITRSAIVASKAAAGLVYILLFNLVLFAFNFLQFEYYKKTDYSMRSFLLLSVGPLMVHIVFAAIGFLISVFVVKAKSIYPVSLGIVLSTFFLNLIASTTESAENLKYFSPFKYIDAADLIVNGGIEGVYIFISATVTAICVICTFVFYNRKEITV